VPSALLAAFTYRKLAPVKTAFGKDAS